MPGEGEGREGGGGGGSTSLGLVMQLNGPWVVDWRVGGGRHSCSILQHQHTCTYAIIEYRRSGNFRS